MAWLFPVNLDFCNRERHPGSLGGQAPMVVIVRHVSGGHSQDPRRCVEHAGPSRDVIW